MNSKYCNKLSSKITPMQINKFNIRHHLRGGTVRDLWSLDDDDRVKKMLAWRSPHWRWWSSARIRRRGRRAMMKNLKKRTSNHEDCFPKTLFALSRYRIIENNGSEDLLSWQQMHVDKWDEVALIGGTAEEEAKTYMRWWLVVIHCC
jgi:hypothetical protein